MRKILLLGQSLLSPQFEILEKSLNDFAASGDTIMIYTGMVDIADCVNMSSRYQHLMRLIDQAGINTETIDAFGLDEYLFTHKEDEEDLFTTPTNAINAVISSVAMTGYKGRVFVCTGFNRSAESPKFQDVQPLAYNYLTSRSFGTKGLQREPLNNPIGYRDLCHFMIDDQLYFQHIGEQHNIQSGQEGITFVMKDHPEWRVKIYDRPLYAFEVTKLELFTKLVDALPYMAIPLSIVYDNQDQPIGIVMRNFKGETINRTTFAANINAETVAKEIARQVIAMQLYGIYHKDLAHNILCNFDNCMAHVIDIDSTQYLNYPAVTKSADKQNGIPIEFDNDLIFYHSIDLSYTLLTIMISAYMNPEHLLGAYNEAGHVILEEEGKAYLKEKAPHLYKIVVDAYEKGIPASCGHQLAAISLDIRDRNQFYFDRIFGFNDESMDEEMKEVKAKEEVRQKKKKKVQKPFLPKPTKEQKPKTKEIFDFHENPDEVKLSPWQKKFLELFLMNAATSIEGESDEERWNRFISTGEYKKPLIYGVVGIVIIILLILIFIFL